MASPIGNPNMETAYSKSTGPKTPIGKMITSLNRQRGPLVKNPKESKVDPNSLAAQVVDFDKSTPEALKKSLEAYHNFVNWALQRKHPTRELTEIAKLEGLMNVMEANLSKALERLGQGEALNDKDRKDMFLMKDTLVAIHEMKYGKKQLNVNTSYKDFRDLMFDEK